MATYSIPDRPSEKGTLNVLSLLLQQCEVSNVGTHRYSITLNGEEVAAWNFAGR